MKFYVKIFICLIVVFSGLEELQSQVAYVNSVAVINSMPETATARQQLDQFSKTLNQQYDSKMKAFETKLVAAQQKAKNGEYTPAQQKEVETALNAEDQQLRKLESESLQQIKDKEKSLNGPIYAKVNAAIAAVAKANAIKMVLDSSAGIVLYADQGVDLTNKVVAKLKLN